MINDHKFYNEYVLPVLEEVQEEFKKRGVMTEIVNEHLTTDVIIFTYEFHGGNHWVTSDYHNFFINKFENGKTQELLFKEFPSPLVEKSIYDLGIGDTYFSISSDGNILQKRIKKDSDLEILKILTGHDNAFLTYEECERRIAKNQAIAKIKRRAHELQGDWKPVWNDADKYNYCFLYDHSIMKFNIFGYYTVQNQGFYFKTKEIAQKIIDELPGECKLMLEVE